MKESSWFSLTNDSNNNCDKYIIKEIIFYHQFQNCVLVSGSNEYLMSCAKNPLLTFDKMKNMLKSGRGGSEERPKRHVACGWCENFPCFLTEKKNTKKS